MVNWVTWEPVILSTRRYQTTSRRTEREKRITHVTEVATLIRPSRFRMTGVHLPRRPLRLIGDLPPADKEGMSLPNHSSKTPGQVDLVERRTQPSRRTEWRGGRRDSDWINRPPGALKRFEKPKQVSILRRVLMSLW